MHSMKRNECSHSIATLGLHITVTSHRRRCVPNHCQSGCWFKSLFRQTQKTSSELRITSLLWLVNFPQQRAITQIARFMGTTWGPRGLVGPSWAPCWPHKPCYQGRSNVENVSMAWRLHGSLCYWKCAIFIRSNQCHAFPDTIPIAILTWSYWSLPEQRRHAMLQLHLSDQQFYCLLRCDLYWRFNGTSDMHAMNKYGT